MSGNISTLVTKLNNPHGLAVDAAGTLYIVNTDGHTVVMVRSGSTTVEPLAGSTVGNADGQFRRPQSIAVGPDGYLYIADTENHRIMRY